MNVNRQELREFAKDFARAVTDLEGKYNVSIKLGAITFGAVDFKAKLTVVSKENGAAEKLLEQDDAKLDFTVGLVAGIKFDAPIRGHQFKDKVSGKIFKVVGLNGKGKKYPVKVESNGKVYKVQALQLRFWESLSSDVQVIDRGRHAAFAVRDQETPASMA